MNTKWFLFCFFVFFVVVANSDLEYNIVLQIWIFIAKFPNLHEIAKLANVREKNDGCDVLS